MRKYNPSGSSFNQDQTPKRAPFTMGWIVGGAIALLVVGAAVGAFIAWNSKNHSLETKIDLNKEIAPDVNAVPKNKPLPPAPKEAVLKQKKYYAVGPQELAKYDTNKDGKVSREEFRVVWESNFRYNDSNKDGKLTRQEFTHSAFPGMDLDKNGTLEIEEWSRYRNWCFDTYFDADKDGFAVPHEWEK